MKNLLISIGLLFIIQTVVWIQNNGQFVSEWIKKSPWIMSLLGVPVSYLSIKATEYGYNHFHQLWPNRIMTFCVGVITFSFMTWYLVGEGLTLKTGISIFLAFVIMIIQLTL
jgi:hypothetical protein